ncbi:MAG: hypothetical protein EOO60_13805 [Hymenobacter sp.]|nr:MAG: hypothetical protein EOO60_13805 [Hymenobacter sp.]
MNSLFQKRAGFAMLLFFALGLCSCGKSPEAAAKEVCDCLSKTTSSQDMGTMAGNAAECQELTAKYQGKYSGEDLNTFTRTLTNCTMGKMGFKQ